MRQATAADIQKAFDKMLKKRVPTDPKQAIIQWGGTGRTSKLAADSMKPYAPTIEEKVLGEIKLRDALGLTCDEVEQIMKSRHQTISSRITHLRKTGKIMDSGRTRLTRSRRSAVVWVSVGVYK